MAYKIRPFESTYATKWEVVDTTTNTVIETHTDRGEAIKHVQRLKREAQTEQQVKDIIEGKTTFEATVRNILGGLF